MAVWNQELRYYISLAITAQRQLAGPFYKKNAVAHVYRCTPVALPQLVDAGFQVLFHSPPGVLFTFPSRYCSSIGHQVVFRLGWWSTRFPTGFHVSRGTLDSAQSASPFAYGVLTLYDRPSQTVRLN